MMIHKIIHSLDYNLWFKYLDTQLNNPTNQNSIKFPKCVKQRLRKRYYITFGTSVINSPVSPPSLINLPSEFSGLLTLYKVACTIFLWKHSLHISREGGDIRLKNFGDLLNFDRLVHQVGCPNVSTINYNLQKG